MSFFSGLVIPVTEWYTATFPLPFKRCLVTVQGSTDLRWVSTGYLDANGEWRNTGGYPMVDRVVAWAENPEPYKGDAEE